MFVIWNMMKTQAFTMELPDIVSIFCSSNGIITSKMIHILVFSLNTIIVNVEKGNISEKNYSYRYSKLNIVGLVFNGRIFSKDFLHYPHIISY